MYTEKRQNLRAAEYSAVLLFLTGFIKLIRKELWRTIKASCEALLDLARDAEFFHGSNEMRKKKVMIIAVRSTLRYKSQNERKQLESLNMK